VLFEEDNDDEIDTSRQPPNHVAVAALLSYSLRSATLEDDEGMTPLDYATKSDASMKTVKLLQSAARKGMQLNAGLQSFITATKCLQDSMPQVVVRPSKKIRRVSVEC